VVTVVALMLSACHQRNYSARGNTGIRAIPQTSNISLNNLPPIPLSGYTVEGTDHFRLQDIARMLNGTQAQFMFTESLWNPGGLHIYRSRRYDTESCTIPLNQQIATAVPVEVTVEVGVLDAAGMSFEVSAFDIAGTWFFTLQIWSDFLGFNFNYADDETIEINTGEHNVGDYGRQVAEAFLSERLSLFREDWWWGESWYSYNEYDTNMPSYCFGREYSVFCPQAFWLYDFNNDGIPEILINYSLMGDWEQMSYNLYAYVDGKYEKTGSIGQGSTFTRDILGEVFFFDGSHYDGFAYMWHMVFNDSGRITFYLVSPTLDGYGSEEYEETEYDESDPKLVQEPVLRSDIEPVGSLTSVNRLFILERNMREAITERMLKDTP